MTRLRVATFNIRHGRGMDGVVNLPRTARAIERARADVIALQEVDRLTERSGGLDEPAVLQELTGMWIGFWPTLEWETGSFGLALAARQEIDARFERLDNLGMGRPHGAVVGEISGVAVVATHLSTHDEARRAEATHLLALVSALERPAVVAGDLNQAWRHLGAFRSMGFTGDRRRRPTFPSWLPLRQIDHVLVSGALRVRRSWTVRTLASDHLPLVAEVERAGAPPDTRQ